MFLCFDVCLIFELVFYSGGSRRPVDKKTGFWPLARPFLFRPGHNARV
jgi:hypothetical protein